MKAMILAAGRGERMRPLTDSLPKPLLEVGGKPLIVYHIERLVAAGVKELVINTAWLGDKLEAALGDGSQWGVSIRYSREGEALETAGGIRNALPLLGDEPFLLVNGDIWTDYAFDSLVQRGLAEGEQAYLVLVGNPDHNPGGDFGLSGGVLVEKSNSQPGITFSGVSVIRPGFIADYPFPAEKMPLVLPLKDGIKRGVVSGEYYSGFWLDVGTPERLFQLNETVGKLNS
ncbi:MAG: nucleotidyltransferase family protein [Cellvibrionaceae bacterium]